MKAKLLRSYLKHNYKGLLIALVLLLPLVYLDRDTPWLTVVLLFLGIGREYYHYGAKIQRIKKLKAKGLTEEDVINIEFVKKWDDTRQTGIYKYCFVDGGIIAGACLSIVISLVIFLNLGKDFVTLFNGPGGMFSFIAYTYMAGAVICVILYRVIWHYRERRFIRLINPFDLLNTNHRKTSDNPA